MQSFITNTPTNLVMGFLGVGKTTAILDLFKQKPENETWAVLVNEFGKIGIDGAIYSSSGITVKEIAGGCLCCAVGLPFQVSVNQLLKDVKPDRLLIEPTGLGHPTKVLEMLVTGSFKESLELRASLCLVDPEKLKDSRYTSHETFIDQIALADVLIANKMDLADSEATRLFHQWANNSRPEKALIAQTQQGQLDVDWLDISRNAQRHAEFPDAHQIKSLTPATHSSSLGHHANGYQSVGYIFPDESCFDYQQLSDFLNQIKVERIKGIVNTDKGWFIINGAEGRVQYTSTKQAVSNRIEVISKQNQCQDISKTLNHALKISQYED